MVDAIGEHHDSEGKDPSGKGDAQLRPSIAGRDGDEITHPLPEPDHDSHIEQAHDADDITMGCFDGPFGTVVHATHTTFAAVRPKWAGIHCQNGLDRTVVDANVTFVAGTGGVKRFGQNKTADEKISNADRRDKQVLDDIAEGRVDLFSIEDF